MLPQTMRVVLLTSPKPLLDYEQSVLVKPFISLDRPTGMRYAFDAICRDLPKLLICEQMLSDGPAQFLLERLAEGLQTRRPPVLLIGSLSSDVVNHLPLQPRLLRTPTPIERFDSVVMEMLGYKPRHARRHMIRLSFKGDMAGGGLIGTSISVSANGMLLESKKKLAPGLNLHLELMGIPELKGLDFPSVVLRAEPPPEGHAGLFYAVGFENADPFNVQQLMAWMDGLEE